MLLLVRGDLLRFQQWIRSDLSPLTNVAHSWMFITLFFASPKPLTRYCLSVVYFIGCSRSSFFGRCGTISFSSFDARRLLRSLAILFGTAFILKHMLLASLYSPEGGWLKRVAGTLLQGVTIGTLDAPSFAPATGYISFFTLTLYVVGLILLASAANGQTKIITHAIPASVVEDYRQVSTARAINRPRSNSDRGTSIRIPPGQHLNVSHSDSTSC
jgi:hypothetical protein